jgi:putative transcriptional regulator
MSATEKLSAPLLLVAMPQVADPFFHKSVVLLVHHDEEGSLGFILNRPTQILVKDILIGLDIPWEGDAAAIAYFGGPVRPQLGTVLFDGAELLAAPEHAADLLPGLALTQHLGDLTELAAQPPERFRLFLGYAGWSAGQLVEEIVRNDWITAPVDLTLLDPAPSTDLWLQVLEQVGLDPAHLAWTAEGSGGPAN